VIIRADLESVNLIPYMIICICVVSRISRESNIYVWSVKKKLKLPLCLIN
jgi:hypothetical protein